MVAYCIFSHTGGIKHRLGFVLLPVLMIFLLSGCIEKFNAPSWDVELNVPVLNKSYTLLEVVNKDSTYLKTDASNQLYYSDKKPFNPIQVDKKLTLNPIQTTSKFGLNTIAITNPDPQVITLTPPTYPSATGTFAVLPESHQEVDAAVPTNSSFESAVFESGTLTIAIQNNNGIQFRIDSLQIIDNRTSGATTVLVKSNTETTIASGATGTITLDLAGKTLYNKVKAALFVYTPPMTNVTIPNTANTKITNTFSNLKPYSVVAPVPAQSPQTMTGAFVLDSLSSLDTVKIAEGSMSFTVNNYFNVALQAVMTVTNLYTASNTQYSTSFSVPAKGSQVVNISSLTDWSIKSASLTNQLGYSVVVTVQQSSSAVSVSKSDSATVKVNMSQLILKSIHGRIKPTALSFDTTTVALELKSLQNLTADSIKMTGLDVNFDVALSAGVKMDFSGTMTGYNSLGNSALLTIPTTRLSGGGATSKVTLSSSELDAFINKFVKKVPDQLRVIYTGTLNPSPSASDPVARITNTDSLFGTINIYAPLNVGIIGGKLIDSTDINVSDENRTNSDKVQSAVVTLELTNSIPAGLTFYGKFLDANGDSVLSMPLKTSGNTYPTVIAPAVVGASGTVTSPTSTKVSMTLTGSEIDKFLNSKKLVYTLLVDTSTPSGSTAGSPVKFYSSDAVKIYAAGSIIYRVSSK
jgi:hypothetical protein